MLEGEKKKRHLAAGARSPECNKQQIAKGTKKKEKEIGKGFKKRKKRK